MSPSFLDKDRFAVWGLARSGIAVANLLARRGKTVVASDIAPPEKLDGLENLHPDVEVVFGSNHAVDAEVVVVSPGLRPGLPVFQGLPDDVAVVSEVEIAFEASNHRWLGITGTDGKTTTTELTTHVLKAAGIPAIAAGNIGTPLSEVVDDLDPDTVIVAEISAFQLWSTHNLQFLAGAITNIADDHLDYFEGDFAAYADAKLKLFENAGSDAAAIISNDDTRLAKWASQFDGRTVGVSARAVADMHFDGSTIFAASKPVFDWSRAPLIGRHNAMNVMMAWALAREVGATDEDIARGIGTFPPLPHRIERVAEVDGVPWVNDSKATNAHAAMAGLDAIDGELVVIAGGVDKRLDLRPFSDYLAGRRAKVVLIGDITERLEASLADAGLETVERAESLEDAVSRAKNAATPGSTVVLSPACSSFDMFASYADRGNQFRDLVLQMTA